MDTTGTTDDLARLLDDAKAAPARRRRRLIGAASLLAALVGGGLFLFGGGTAPPAYETAALTRGQLEVTITATGKVQGVNTVEVGAEVSGRVVEVLVDHNSQVEQGQLLARIDPEQQAAALEEASARLVAADASVRQARATREEAEANFRRAEEQDREGLIARQELDTIRAAALRARAAVSSADAQARLERANVTSAKSRLDRTEIRAPIKGMILSRLVEPGQTVTAGFQTPVLFKVTADLRRMRLHAQVDESDIGKVRQGQRARFTVDAWPDRIFEADVEAVRNEPVEESTVVSYETLLTVDNSDGLLRPGMTATATIVVDDRKDALLVPNAALRFQPPSQGNFRGPQMPGMPRPAGQRGPDAPRGPAVWIESESGPVPVPVEVVATDGRQSEIAPPAARRQRAADAPPAFALEAGTRVIVNLAEASP